MRRLFLPLLLMTAPAAAFGQASDASVTRFNECAAIQDDTQRLACFDRVTREVRASAQPSAATPSSPAATQQARVREERESFGLDARQQQARRPAQAKPIDRLTARVAAIRPFGAGYWAIMLDDGAIWEIREAKPTFRAPRRGETIRIRRGAMGGYLLYAGGQSSVRITRVS